MSSEEKEQATDYTTPRPWRLDPEAENDLAAIVGPNANEPPVMLLDGAELEDDDLDLMLRSVNSHDELLAALKAADEWIQTNTQAVNRPARLDKQIMDTIARAEQGKE